MGIGLALNQIDCNVETASGGWARRRDRQRARGSDELAIFAVMHSLSSDAFEPLAHFKYYRENVDSGDTFRPEQSMLAPDDSVDELLVTLIALEIDGAGSGLDKANRYYQKWVEVTNDRGNYTNPTGNPSRSSRGTAIFDMGSGWWSEEIFPDLIALDRFSASRAGFGEFVNHSTGIFPEMDDYETIRGKGVEVEGGYNTFDGQFLATRRYRSSAANSDYSLTFEFRLS